MSGSGTGKDAGGADQARRLASSTETDLGGRSHGGPGHGVALPAAGRGWALSKAQWALSQLAMVYSESVAWHSNEHPRRSHEKVAAMRGCFMMLVVCGSRLQMRVCW